MATIDFFGSPLQGGSFWPPILKIGGEDRRLQFLEKNARPWGFEPQTF
jgi:hypothetical protein